MSRNPEGRGSIPRLDSRRSSLISIEHAELLRSTPSLVLCCAWLVTMALHVHCGLGQLSPLPTSGDDKWVAAKHCGRAKRSRISDTHRLRSSLQFRYINNQSLLLLVFELTRRRPRYFANRKRPRGVDATPLDFCLPVRIFWKYFSWVCSRGQGIQRW